MQKAPLGSARICRAVGAQIADTYYTNIFDLTLPAGLSAVRGAISPKRLTPTPTVGSRYGLPFSDD
jgi:hypothetical protein